MFRVMEQAIKKSSATPRSASIDLAANNVRSSSQFYSFNTVDISEPNSNGGTPPPSVNRMMSLGINVEDADHATKKLMDSLHRVKEELEQQREFSNMLNKTHQELQLQYSKDTQQWMAQISELSRERQELMKDLDLALEREANAAKKLQTESTKLNDNLEKLPMLNKQISMLQSQNEKLIANNDTLQQMTDKIDQLMTLQKMEANKNAENHEKIKLVFEDTAVQLDKYHQNQQIVSSLKNKLQLNQNETQENLKLLQKWIDKTSVFVDVDLGHNSRRVGMADTPVSVLSSHSVAHRHSLPTSASISLHNMDDMIAHDWSLIHSKLALLEKNIVATMSHQKHLRINLNQDLEALSEQVETKATKATELSRENQQLKVAITELKQRYIHHTDDHYVQTIQPENVTQNIQTEVSSIPWLNGQDQQLQTEKPNYIDASMQHENSIINCMTSLGSQTSIIGSPKKIIDQQSIEKQQKLINEKNEVIENLENEIENAKQNENNINTKMDKLKSEIESKEETINEMKSQINQLSNQVGSLTNETEQLNSTILRLNESNETHSSKEAEIESENSKLEAKCKQLLQINAELKEKFKQNKMNQIKKYEIIAKKVSALRNIIDAKDKEIKELKSELEIAHKQFFKLLQHASQKPSPIAAHKSLSVAAKSLNGNNNNNLSAVTNDNQDETSNKSKKKTANSTKTAAKRLFSSNDLSNNSNNAEHSLKDLAEMRKQLKILEKEFTEQ